ncbi:LIM-domain binding protein, partial [Vararia minispora EC-137]
LGTGQALQRLIQFSGMLATEDPEKKCKLSYWHDIMKDYFADNAVMRLILWRDNGTAECKTFDVTTPVIPRFFLVTSQSGVKSMTLSFDGARERVSSPLQADVHCVAAVWTYRYYNGYTVTLRGPLVAQL